jgi:hypothetical protein
MRFGILPQRRLSVRCLLDGRGRVGYLQRQHPRHQLQHFLLLGRLQLHPLQRFKPRLGHVLLCKPRPLLRFGILFERKQLHCLPLSPLLLDYLQLQHSGRHLQLKLLH